MSISSIVRMVLWLVMILGGGILSYYLDSLLFEDIKSNIIFLIISFVVGVFLLRLVLKISRNTGRTLSKYGRKGNISRMETNILATEGIYKFMRHPMHLGLLFFPVSIAFLICSPSFILIISPLEIIFMLIMIKFVEEPDAIKKFGTKYLDYMQKVPWFCFNMECLKELFKPVPKIYNNTIGNKYVS